jgi:hypothetical protein
MVTPSELEPDVEAGERKPMSVRFPTELRERLTSIARTETQARKQKKRPGVVSVNSLLISIAEKHCAAWAKQFGGIVPVDLDALEKTDPEIERKARVVLEIRNRKNDDPCPKCEGRGVCSDCEGSGVRSRAGHSKK